MLTQILNINVTFIDLDKNKAVAHPNEKTTDVEFPLSL